ncbi:MAG: ATP-grasp domain-containing protein [Desulfobulbaceae bacterium]
MTNVLGIISRQGKDSYASYYEREAYDFYDEVLYIDPREVEYTVRRGDKMPEIVYEGRSLNNLSMAYVLSPPPGTWKLTILLVKYLMAAGCPVSDTFDMFRRDGIGKAYEALASQKYVGTTCYLATSLSSGTKIIEKLTSADFPLVTKPVYGHHGKGIAKVDTADEAKKYLQQHFKKTKDFLILEKFITYTKEWRVYVVDGTIVGSYGKSASPGSFIANLHQGAQTLPSEPMDEVYAFIESHLPEQCARGIYGLDVGLSATGEIHVIETNRCPGWKGLRGTGINFPYEANRILFNRARKLEKG